MPEKISRNYIIWYKFTFYRCRIVPNCFPRIGTLWWSSLFTSQINFSLGTGVKWTITLLLLLSESLMLLLLLI